MVSCECRGCAKINGLEVKLVQLRQLVVTLVGMEEVGYASGSGGGGQWMTKWCDWMEGERPER